MRLAERFIALEPTAFSKTINDAPRDFETLALGIVDDSRSIAAAMHAGRKPTRRGTRKFCRFRKKINECLLSSFWNGEYIDLGDDVGVCMNSWHSSIPRMLRRDGADRSTHVGSRPRHVKPPTPSRRLLAVGSPTGDTELPEGRDRAYRMPILVLFDTAIIGWSL
jgi:hypothetical protein